jgi:hypothetical protein
MSKLMLHLYHPLTPEEITIRLKRTAQFKAVRCPVNRIARYLHLTRSVPQARPLPRRL